MSPGPPANPRTLPSRPWPVVIAETRRNEDQRSELEATMARTGQTGALVIAPTTAHRTAGGGYTSATWTEGPIGVLPVVDVLVLFAQPRSIDGPPEHLAVRWDVVARVCGRDCWREMRELHPPRVITWAWPDDDQMAVLRALTVPHADAP